nr:MAG TPA: hypothetical protein [Caudoviricetes sp.]DAV07795.1 MAG TPA: hypothetical protein [Caudoviricetes sp.]
MILKIHLKQTGNFKMRTEIIKNKKEPAKRQALCPC